MSRNMNDRNKWLDAYYTRKKRTVIRLKVSLSASLSFNFADDPSDEFPGHVETVDLNAGREEPEPELGTKPLREDNSIVIEKSNLMLLGPSGVGKTYILQ